MDRDRQGDIRPAPLRTVYAFFKNTLGSILDAQIFMCCKKGLYIAWIIWQKNRLTDDKFHATDLKW